MPWRLIIIGRTAVLRAIATPAFARLVISSTSILALALRVSASSAQSPPQRNRSSNIASSNGASCVPHIGHKPICSRKGSSFGSMCIRFFSLAAHRLRLLPPWPASRTQVRLGSNDAHRLIHHSADRFSISPWEKFLASRSLRSLSAIIIGS
jgi:hypothetical protein